MHPLLIDILFYVVLPLLRYFKVIWQIGVALVRLLFPIVHFFTGGVFLSRPPIERNLTKTRSLRVMIDSNFFPCPFNEVRGLPEDQSEPGTSRSRTTTSRSSRSRTPSTENTRTRTPSNTSWMTGERAENRVTLSEDPYLQLGIQTIEEGQSYKFHG